LFSAVPASRQNALLGLFPGLCLLGGIQASGQLAWEGICRDERLSAFAKRLVCYDPHREHDWPGTGGEMVVAPSNQSAWRATRRMHRGVTNVLVWHLSLLRFMPFFRPSNAKVTLFLHGIEAWQRPNFLVRRALSRVDCFLSNSDYTWQRFQQFHQLPVPWRHKLVPLGLGEVPPASRPAATPAALMLGRLMRDEDYKGHREVIAAWPLVLKQMPQAALWIAGDGDLRPELQSLAEARGVGERVHFWGCVSEEKKRELLAQARCLALPSRGEGFGLVYLEAMRQGRPCLVSGLDAGAEVVNPPECGLAAAPGQPEKLAAALCRLLAATDEWAAWSQRARQRYEARFTARHFQDRLVAALLDDGT
jgi:glycosyltransferase involved in cell wall biosynthesis